MKTIYFFFLSVIFLLSSCKGQTQTVVITKAEQTSDENDTVKLITATAGLQKKYPVEYAYFKKQKDRFEFQECKLYYNGQQLKLDTLHLMEKVIGKNYTTQSDLFFRDKPLIVMYGYTEQKTDENNPDLFATSLSIKLTQYDDAYNPTKRDSLMRAVPILDGYVLINGVPVNADMDIEDVNRRIADEGYYPFSTHLSNYIYTRQYSANGVYYSHCSPDPRVEKAWNDWIIISFTIDKESNGVKRIFYEYEIEPNKQ